MNRRDILTVVGGTLVGGALSTRAQAATSVGHIGILSPGVRPDPAEIQRVWAPARELGWIEGQNLIVERRYAGGKAELLRPYAEELVRLNVEVIVTLGTAAAIAAKNATTRIPMVRPRATLLPRRSCRESCQAGRECNRVFIKFDLELDVKRLELLRELLPNAQRVGVLLNSANPYHDARGE